MSKKQRKKKDPIRTLLKSAILLAVVALICFGVVQVIDTVQQGALDQEIKKVEKENEAAQAKYLAEKASYEEIYQAGSGTNEPKPEKGVGWEIVVLEDLPTGSSVAVDRNTLLTGGLMLVNKWHELPSDVNENILDLVSISEESKARRPDASAIQTGGTAVRLQRDAANAVIDLIFEAEAMTPPLQHLTVNAAYRSWETQQENFDKEIARLGDRYTGDELQTRAEQNVNRPGTSEYQTGLTFHLTLYNREAPTETPPIFTSDSGKWFLENSWKKGFVFRFPVDGYPDSKWVGKSNITGIHGKLVLFRYVGTPHAVVMQGMDMENNAQDVAEGADVHYTNMMVLEEYVEYLIRNKHIKVYRDGKLMYEIYRIPISSMDMSSYTVAIPVEGLNADQMYSFDNMGGIVVALTYGTL